MLCAGGQALACTQSGGMCACPAAYPHVPTQPALAGPNFSLDVPAYSSLPGAPATVYLDFDGDYTPQWGQYQPGQTPPYSLDSDFTSFNPQELFFIQQIWQRVTEKFSPFNINVTTVDPGNRNNLETVHVVIGGDGRNGAPNYWPGFRAGGVAYVGAFTNNWPNTVFVFPGNLLNGNPKLVAEASAHETGHAFWLNHQTLFDAQGNFITEYNPGDALRAPIMGRSYESQRGLWWNGTWLTPNTIQDDLQAISDPFVNQFGYRPDDHGNTPATATPMLADGDLVSAFGVIEQTSDMDYFSFETLAGDVSFTLAVAPFGPMLDASLSLFDAAGMLLIESATASLGESISTSLSDGLYYLAVSSAGNYGDLGQYWLSGTVVAVPEPAFGAVVGLAALSLLARSRTVRSSRRA